MKAVTDSLGYMPDGPWTQCLEKAVKYESTNKDWRRDRRYQSRTRTPQGPAGQVVELFAERVVEAQIHLEDCLSNIEDSHQQPAAQRIKKLALRAYAHDTQHEKIIRACALALAMMMFRKEEEAEPLIQEMLLDKDAILRYGGCFAIALAYVGTSQNAAIRKLLHISVSDVSDDVRRAAVMALGFVMCNVPEQLPGVVKLLAESYNPHVRYAAAMALGIACAGTALLEAHNLLQPLMSDPSDFVRQGAIIAMGLLYMQTSPGKTERVKVLFPLKKRRVDKQVQLLLCEEFRDKLQKVIGDKHEDVMTRFGAILAHGIMDAGGRNSCASLFSKSGVLRRALIGITDKLKIPKNFSVKSGARPSIFAYPEPLQPPKKEETAKAATAVLSTAAKAKQLKEKKDQQSIEANELKKASSSADVDMDDKASIGGSYLGLLMFTQVSVAATPGTTVVGSAATESVAASDLGSEMMEVDEQAVATEKAAPEQKEEKKEEKKEEPEPTEEILSNPCRVLKGQVQYISFPKEIDGQPELTLWAWLHPSMKAPGGFAFDSKAHPFKISPGMTVVDLMDEMELAGFTVHAM
eukprot:g7151.t1